MRAEFDKIIYEATGRKGNAAWVARVYRRAEGRLPKRLEFAEGATQEAAGVALEAAPMIIPLDCIDGLNGGDAV